MVCDDGPLTGVNVLELGSMVAGPFGGTLLADFGARVAKLEAEGGDPLRYVEPTLDGLSLYWVVDGRNKQAAACNLKADDDKRQLLELVRWADVLIENFRAGTLERWGLGPSVLQEHNPELVIVRVTGYGQDGARAGTPAYDRVVQAMSGIAAVTGHPGGPPTVVGNFISDYLTGVFTAFGAMLGLRAVAEGAGGQIVDVASLDCLVRLSEVGISQFDRFGTVRARAGNSHPAAAPINAYQGSDAEWVMLHVPTDRMFRRLCSAIDRDELAEDARFVTMGSRVRNRAALDAQLSEWFLARTAAAAVDRLVAEGIPAALVHDASDLAVDEELHRRGTVVRTDSPLGSLLMQGVVPKLSRTPGRIRTPAPGPELSDLATLIASVQAADRGADA